MIDPKAVARLEDNVRWVADSKYERQIDGTWAPDVLDLIEDWKRMRAELQHAVEHVEHEALARMQAIEDRKRLREALDAYQRLLGSARPTLHTPEDDEDTVLGVSLYFTKDQDDELDRVRELTRKVLEGGQG